MEERRHPTVKMSLCLLDELALVVAVRAPGGEAIQWLERQVLSLPATGKLSYMQVVVPSSNVNPVVPEGDRQAMVHFARACQPRFQGAAFVLLLDGFLGATVRSVLAAVTMVARPTIPVKMFASVSEGATWLGRATTSRLPPATHVADHVARRATAMGLGLGLGCSQLV